MTALPCVTAPLRMTRLQNPHDTAKFACIRGKEVLLHEAAGVLASGATNRQPIHLQRRNAYAYRDSLTIFAAGAHAFVEFQVIADHADAGQDIRTVADQRGAFDRRSNL